MGDVCMRGVDAKHIVVLLGGCSGKVVATGDVACNVPASAH